MARQWYYSQGGKQKGPVSVEQLKQLTQTGVLLPTDLLWSEGFTEWRPASAAKGLTFAQAKPVTPPLLPGDKPAALPADNVLAGGGMNAPAYALVQRVRQWWAQILPRLQQCKQWFLRQPRWRQVAVILAGFFLLGLILPSPDVRTPSTLPLSTQKQIYADCVREFGIKFSGYCLGQVVLDGEGKDSSRLKQKAQDTYSAGLDKIAARHHISWREVAWIYDRGEKEQWTCFGPNAAK